MKMIIKILFLLTMVCVLSGNLDCKAAEIVYSGTSGDLNWSIDSEGLLTIEGVGDYSLDYKDMSILKPGWCKYEDDIKNAIIKVNGITITRHMFSDCENLLSIDLSQIDTSQVIDMSYMFHGCSKLTEIDLNELESDNVTTIQGMFSECYSLESLDLSKFNTSRVIDMSDLFYDCVKLESLNIKNIDTSMVTDMSNMFNLCQKLTDIDISRFDTSQVENMNGMFKNCNEVKFLDVSKFDTSQVIDMGYMFNYCYKLEDLDVSGFNTNKVTDMSFMFSDCASLKSLDVSKFNTSQVTDIHYMFSGCINIKDFEIDNFDTSQVTDIRGMFSGCSNLTSLDISNFNTSQVIDMSAMFHGCTNLQTLNVASFDTGQVTDMDFLFRNCSNLQTLDLSNFDTSHVTDMGQMFTDCYNLTSLDINSFNTSQVTNMTYMFNGCENLISLDLSSFDFSQVTSFNLFFDDCKELSTIKMPSNLTLKISFPEYEEYLWKDIENVTCTYAHQNLTEAMTYNRISKIQSDILNGYKIAGGTSGDLEWCIYSGGTLVIEGVGNYDKREWSHYSEIITAAYVKVSGITSTKQLFYNCKNLNIVDLSQLDTTNVIDMSNMFYYCSSLTKLDVSGFDTSNVTNMSSMFSRCMNIRKLYVSKFDTSNVTDMSSMFYYCNKLNKLDISGFDTSNVNDMSYMFSNCRSLTKLDVSGFDTNNVNDMSYMFGTCLLLPEIDVNSFNTENVTNMRHMFSECYKIVAIDVSNFDTSKVTNMEFMFYHCNKLTYLDISNFNTVCLTTAENMLEKCTSLETIKTPIDLNFALSLPDFNSYIWKDENNITCTTAHLDLATPMTYTRILESEAMPNPEPVSSEIIILDGYDEIQLNVGDTNLALEGIRKTGDGTLTYTIINGTDVINLTGDGKISALSVGAATIKLSMNATDNYLAAEPKYINVTVNPAPSEIIISEEKDNLSLLFGDTDITLDSISKTGDGILTYTITSGNDVISITEDGKVTALATGTATIKISMDATDNYLAAEPKYITVTVNLAPSEIIIAEGKDILSLLFGDTDIALNGISKTGNGILTYTITSGTDVISITEDGKVTALAAGTATIKISMDATDNYLAAEPKYITVTVNPAPSEIIIAEGKNILSLLFGDTDIVLEGISKIGDGILTYSITSGTDVISITEDGKVSALTTGTAIIELSMAATDNYLAPESKNITVTVNPVPSEIIIAEGKDKISLTVGERNIILGGISKIGDGSLIYTVTEGTDIIYVTEDGRVMALSAGTATIELSMAATDNYQAAEPKYITVTVNPVPIVEPEPDPEPVPDPTPQPQPSEIIIEAGKEDVILTVGDTDILLEGISKIGDGTLTYTIISGTDIINVTRDGKVTALSVGTATIELSMDATDNYLTAEPKYITVTVNPAPIVEPEPEPTPDPEPVPDQKPTPDLNTQVAPKPIGTLIIHENSNGIYIVTSNDTNNPAVTFTGMHNKKSSSLTIPEYIVYENITYKVTGIKAKACKNSKKLTKVTISSGITEIGTSAFEGCKKLKSITIGDGTGKIGKNTFKNCKNLKKITIKSTQLKSVGKGSFKNIHSKCKIKVPSFKLKKYEKLLKNKGQKKTVKITK